MFRQAWNIATLAALVGLAVMPREYLLDSPDLCMWRQVAGVECLGCGGTRAVVALLHGHMTEALRTNASAIAIAMWMATTAVHDLARACFRKVKRRSQHVIGSRLSFHAAA
jgi:hypothetical protein